MDLQKRGSYTHHRSVIPEGFLMRNRTLLLAIGAAIGGMVLSLLVPIASAQSAPPEATQVERPPPGSIDIRLVTVNGSGCPDATGAAVAVAPDHTAFTVTYRSHRYLARVGVGAGPTERRKNCQLSIQFHIPHGFTYAIAKADYRGYAHLAKGASGQQRANYYFQGSSQTVHYSHTFDGPRDGIFQTTDVVPVTTLVWAPCGARHNFNVNTELRVNAGSSDPSKTSSFLRMGSTDGSIKTKFNLSWKHCP